MRLEGVEVVPSSQPKNPSSSTQTNIEFYTSDFGNKKGSICYVGTFGTDAQIRGCALSNICKVNLALRYNLNSLKKSIRSLILAVYFNKN